MSLQNKDRLMTADEVALRLRCSKRKVYYLMGLSHFLVAKIGSSSRIYESSVEDYLKRVTNYEEFAENLQFVQGGARGPADDEKID